MHPRHLLAAFAAALVAPLALAAPASASTGGTPDGERHPNVGLLVSYTDTGRYRCSGTLVSPTVVLTAAHCTDGVDGKVAIDFDSVIAEAPPSPLPVAADVDAGYTQTELEKAGYLSGTPSTHPDYSDFTDPRNWNDVGVVVLDRPVSGIAPASIAGLGTLDRIKTSDLSKTLFTAVGYGTEVRKPDNGPQKPQPMSYPLIRRYVDMPGQKLTPQILQTNGNPNDNKGTGGTCFGDSGGPVFYQGRIVAVTSYGYTDNCRYLGGYQRVDITAAQDWLATFGL
ncbi:pterin-4-alpha-carbinolamine dehydratase [Marmoricola sp. Leaf446]|uniref:S1 family peptidase n=1 Tax=Marmoricola sp. Leaf446 TaxID=1736379 RepID=UPI0006FFC5AD|nr:trypsin-like serine protease [Marmoricola sp. Leaf446]KQT89288.1 pterin-4-alpha-carbinolamine dehydratase [Marmoricola sp. Leaf446]